MSRKVLSILLSLAMVLSLLTSVYAEPGDTSSPSAELEWLIELGYENVSYISRIEPGTGPVMTVPVPEGANLILVKGGSGDNSRKVIEITEDMFTDIDGNPYVEGIKYITVDSVGLLNNAGNQPDISHISFFKADAYFWLAKFWKDAPGETGNVITDEVQIALLNSELVLDAPYTLGKNFVPYFGEYTINEISMPAGYLAEVGQVTVKHKGTGTFVNYLEPVTPYSIISGFKFDANQEGLGFTDVSFDFEIYKFEGEVETLVAIAKSVMDGTGALKFQWTDTEEPEVWFDSIELDEGTYKINELSKTGYDFVKTMMFAGLSDPVEGNVPSITFVSGEIENFSFEFYNKKAIVYNYETAYAFNGLNAGGTLNSIRGQNNWGWYLGVNASTATNVYDIYAGAGQNNIAKGTKVGTVTFVIDANGYYQPQLALNPGILLEEVHFGAYKKTTDIPKGPGLFTNLVKAIDAKVLVLHLVVGIPQN